MTVLFNPVYFTFLLIMLAASLVFFILRSSITFLTNFYSYIIVQLGMVGPLLRILQGLVGEVRRCRLSPLAPFFILTIRSYNVKRLLDYVNISHNPAGGTHSCFPEWVVPRISRPG